MRLNPADTKLPKYCVATSAPIHLKMAIVRALHCIATQVCNTTSWNLTWFSSIHFDFQNPMLWWPRIDSFYYLGSDVRQIFLGVTPKTLGQTTSPRSSQVWIFVVNILFRCLIFHILRFFNWCGSVYFLFFQLIGYCWSLFLCFIVFLAGTNGKNECGFETHAGRIAIVKRSSPSSCPTCYRGTETIFACKSRIFIRLQNY